MERNKKKSMFKIKNKKLITKETKKKEKEKKIRKS